MFRSPARRRLAAAALTMSLLVAIPAGAQAEPAGTAAAAMSDAHRHGPSAGRLSARWWQWALSAPVPTNPLLDATGEDCAVGQRGPVWFLAGTWSAGAVTRACSVPAGKSLFFPVLNSIFIATEPGETEQLAHATVRAFVDSIDVAQAGVEVDGRKVRHLASRRAHSPTFDVRLPDDNIFGIAAGTYGPSAADGYYVLLDPLRPGHHTVHIHGVFPDGGVLDVTYDLKVARR